MKTKNVKGSKRRWIVAGLIVALFLALMPSGKTQAATGGFRVSGTKLYDANGNEFVMRGVNYPHAWFQNEYQTAIPAIAAKGFNCVRIVVADGQQYGKTSKSELENLVKFCKENNLVAILEVHDATGSDSQDSLNQAVNYWKEMKDVLKGNEAYVIVNIANEWYGTWDNGDNWKRGYISAIQSLRSAGISNTLMVDCAGWGQYPQVIFEHGQAVLNADSQKNTMFSIHMYEYAGGNAQTVKNNIDSALNKNLCLTIGEFGGYHSNGDVDEDTIMSYCQEKNVGWLAWSWKGNNSDLSYLDLAYDWSGNSLTSFGERVINGANGTSSTSCTCTVFNGGSVSGGSSEEGGTSTGGQGITNLFYGSAAAYDWQQAVSVYTSKNGGNLNSAIFSEKGFFWVEYSGMEGKLELILQSWSGGAGWAKVAPTETGWTNQGTCYAKFSQQACKNAFGSDYSKLDAVHVGATGEYLKVISLDYTVE